MSDQLGVEYAGKALESGGECFWKVRVWGRSGGPGPWSGVGHWSTGLLYRADWKAQWISSPILADPANRPRTPIHCYRSVISHDPDTRKWVSLDLGSQRTIDEVTLAPARPNGLTFDIGTVQFPRRFRILAADNPNFREPTVLVDQTSSDFPEPRSNSCEFKFAPTTRRYLRLDVTKLGVWDAHDYGVFLAQFAAFSGRENVSVGAGVSVSDSIEDRHWSKKYLVEEHPNVEFASFPEKLDPHVPDVFSPSRTALLRRDFTLSGAIRRATLFSTARGFYEPRINGRRVSDDLLAPGFTDYRRRISYQRYDVTKLLHIGPNTAGAILGYGWYAGHMNLGGNAYLYGYFPQWAAQLEIELVDGRRVTIGTDGQWRTTIDGPVRWSDLLDGEAYDFRMEMPGWDEPRYKASKWQLAWSQPLDPERLIAQEAPPVRRMREMAPVIRKQIRPGVWTFDLGQEISGWVRLRAGGPSGTHIVVQHTEAIKADGEIDSASLWGTPQRDDYFLDGNGRRTLEPHFTYHGFRYFQVSGLATPPKAEDVVAIDIHNEVDEIGDFQCSNPLFNRLMKASKWTQRNLLFDVPAGCAARSERLAWTGDIRPCVQTALFNFDTIALFEKYSADLRDDQKPDGRFTDICPHAHLSGTDICVGSPGWADAGVSLPWDVYVNTGDRRLLAEHYDAAKRWVDFVWQRNPNLIWLNDRGMDWGDWLSAGTPTPKEIGATAFFAHSVDLVSRMARVLGRNQDSSTYAALFSSIKAAFAARYVSHDGTIQLPASQEPDVQGSYALALRFGLLDGPQRDKAIQRLSAVVVRDDGHPTTGFWSTVELVLALSESGLHEKASKMVDLTSPPSWGHMVESGGTTFWEAFDADKKTLSLNHWTHSACGEWLWREVAGLSPDPELPGYRGFTVHPRPTPQVSWCRSEFRSVRGPIRIVWRQEDERFTMGLTVPTGSVAQVYIPGFVQTIRESGRPIGRAPGIRFLRSEDGTPVYAAASGSYSFTSNLDAGGKAPF